MTLDYLRPGSIVRRLKRAPADSADVRVTVLNLTRQAEIANRVRLAGNGRNRRKGLLGCNALGAGEGLWIVPCEAVHTFWMRFPIDLVYLDRKHRVVKIRTNVRPWRLSACLRAHSVIEFAAGTVSRTQTLCGDSLSLMITPLED